MKAEKKSIRKITMWITAVCVLFLSYGFNSFVGTGIIRITADLSTGYPIVNIINNENPDISIRPVSSDVGSIGYEIDGKLNWLRGNPGKTEVMETSVVYTWDLDSGSKVILSADMKSGDPDFKLTYDSKDGKQVSKWFLNFSAKDDEYFTGIFERVIDGVQSESWKDGITETLNLRGQKIDVKLKPTVSAYAPFYLSSKNYGFFVKDTWPGVIDFCNKKNTLVEISFEGPELPFKIYLGNSPAEIVKKHALETGPSVVPPEWVFGPWRWRDEHKNREKYYDSTKVTAPYNSEIVEDVLMMKAFNIPCTAYWIDRPWGPGPRGYDDFEIDYDRLPQFENMVKWLNKNNMELMLWIGPYVMGKMTDYAESHDYYLISRDRVKAKQVLMDFTNKDGVKWWGENGPAKLAKMGVKGFKLDRADGEKLLDSLNLKTSIGTTYRENFNDYPHQYVKATYDAVKTVLGNDFVLFPRAQYTGSARYGGLWAGDTNGKQEGLRSVIIGAQRCAVMGYPIWGSDTGGYWGQFNHETTTRWLGFSCFTPIMEVGPTSNLGFWDNPTDPKYDVTLLATWRLYTNIRMKIQDYIYSLVKEANETGMPVVRPLFLTYPKQKEAWNDWQTFTLGNDILVSAIWQNGVTKHKLYLPAGEQWIDAWDTENVYDGGKYITVDAPVYKIPVFIRKGSNINLGDLNKLYEESVNVVSQKPDLDKLQNEENWK